MVFKSTSKTTSDLALTVYNEDFAVVKEKRAFKDYNRQESVQYMDVSEMIETDSIIIKGLEIQELNYDYDLVDKTKLLKKYIDQNVFLYDQKENTKKEYRLLSVSHGLVLENLKTNEIVIDPKEELILPKLPEGLITKPSLIWKVKPQKVDEIDVTYTTGGLKWEANYVVHLSKETLDLTGWVLLTNNSGTTFENARLKLIAGEVNRVKDLDPVYERQMLADSPIVYSENQFEEKSFNDYHLYSLQGKTTLKNQQEKQISLLTATDVSYERYYEYRFEDEKARIMIDFSNTKANQLGLPFPKGKMKVYSEDEEDASLEFIGEDTINHTPKEEDIKLYLGDAFDIVCESRGSDTYKKGKHEYYEFEYVLKNQKDEAATMIITHPIYRKHWKMSETSHEYRKRDASHIEFEIIIPANKVETIAFTYVINHSIHVIVD
ncbi:DUF4139 domain-containing protein [Virgibacillus sp. C22-A2]|uniref:DUF4139 domain-containing protein n=1 Tax=Virgibacillus tibetensis TaxID=3042313 RepID=A0ABU6KIB3_9BACI|nr:DUF4139 domain-containing protein [Virgibacillus sp. C22-A2]